MRERVRGRGREGRRGEERASGGNEKRNDNKVRR